MRVLIAPDQFLGSLTAVQAAESIAEGWLRQAPRDQVDLCPMSDGGSGFIDVLHRALGGEVFATAVPGPHGSELMPAALLRVGGTAYLEAAQVCGLSLAGRAPAHRVTSYGVGTLIAWAVDQGAEEIVVGLGDTAVLDGGAGLLAGLGVSADVPLDEGVAGLDGIGSLDLGAARELLSGRTLTAVGGQATPLTGLFGAARTLGGSLELSESDIVRWDGVLERFAVAADRRRSLDPGAGAAGGIGFAALLLGGSHRSGLDLVVDQVRLSERARGCDVVVTGERSFDFSSRSGTVPYGVAAVAGEALRPCIALAGQVHVGSREMRALGVESAYSAADLIGEERLDGDPAGALADLAARVARTWSR